jgi:hypothetical protein
MSRHDPVAAVLRRRGRQLLLCTLLAAPLWAFANPVWTADEEFAAAAETSRAQPAALLSTADVVHELKLSAAGLPPAAVAVTVTPAAVPEGNSYFLLLACLIAVAVFMVQRRRD